jgi:hypothetical protein
MEVILVLGFVFIGFGLCFNYFASENEVFIPFPVVFLLPGSNDNHFLAFFKNVF